MKVVLFTDSDQLAGTEQHMLDLGRGLRALGVAVLYACPEPSPLAARAREDGLGVFPVPKQGLIDWRAAWRLGSLLKARSVDVIHCHNGRTHVAAALAVAGAGRGALVATQHFITPSRLLRRGFVAWLARALHAFASRYTRRTVAISQAVALSIEEHHLARPGTVAIVANGIEDAVAPRPEPESNSLRVFCAARLEPEKDVFTLLDAMERVAIPGVACWVAGEGSQRAALEAKVRQLGLEPKVRFLGYRTDVRSLVARCDVFVLPSPAEPFGLVLLEAMAAGRPVVAVAAGGPLDIVVDGETGLLVPAHDGRAMAMALQRLLTDAAERQRLGQNGRRRFEERFTRDRMAKAMRAVYQAVLA